MLFNKGLVLAKEETTFRTDPGPSSTVNALEVIAPDFTPEFSLIERETITGDLSPKQGNMGRKLGRLSFSVEVKNGGTAGTAARIDPLLKACSMVRTATTASGTFLFGTTAFPINGAGELTFSVNASYTGTVPRRVHIRKQASAAVDIYAAATTADSAVKALATATAGTVTLVNSASISSVDISGAAIGDSFSVFLVPAGLKYQTTTHADDADNQSCTLWFYVDGVLHKMRGCRGTFSVEATSGEFGVFNFDFTGDYVVAADATFPTTITYETTVPPITETAALSIAAGTGRAGGVDDVQDGPGSPASIVASSFGFDIGNSIAPRLDVTSSDGYAGAKVTGRAPTFSVDPEVNTIANQDLYSHVESGQLFDVMAGIGGSVGNRVYFFGPQAQMTAANYADRDNTRVFNVESNLVRKAGNDEFAVWLG